MYCIHNQGPFVFHWHYLPQCLPAWSVTGSEAIEWQTHQWTCSCAGRTLPLDAGVIWNGGILLSHYRNIISNPLTVPIRSSTVLHLLCPNRSYRNPVYRITSNVIYRNLAYRTLLLTTVPSPSLHTPHPAYRTSTCVQSARQSSGMDRRALRPDSGRPLPLPEGGEFKVLV